MQKFLQVTAFVFVVFLGGMVSQRLFPPQQVNATALPQLPQFVKPDPGLFNLVLDLNSGKAEVQSNLSVSQAQITVNNPVPENRVEFITIEKEVRMEIPVEINPRPRLQTPLRVPAIKPLPPRIDIVGLP